MHIDQIVVDLGQGSNEPNLSMQADEETPGYWTFYVVSQEQRHVLSSNVKKQSPNNLPFNQEYHEKMLSIGEIVAEAKGMPKNDFVLGMERPQQISMILDYLGIPTMDEITLSKDIVNLCSNISRVVLELAGKGKKVSYQGSEGKAAYISKFAEAAK